MQDIKKIVIKDCGQDKYFTIHAFDAMSGIDFLDRFCALLLTPPEMRGKISIKPLLGDLLPLATHTDPSGENVIAQMSISNVNTYFQSPLAVVELGVEILKHQMGFMNDSALFRQYKQQVENTFHIASSD